MSNEEILGGPIKLVKSVFCGGGPRTNIFGRSGGSFSNAVHEGIFTGTSLIIMSSSSLVQHCTNGIQMFCVCWDAYYIARRPY